MRKVFAVLELLLAGLVIGAAVPLAHADLMPAYVNGSSSVDIPVYAGTTGTLSLNDATVKYAVWTPENTSLASITDANKASCYFPTPGMAIFKVVVFRSKASDPNLQQSNFEAFVKVLPLPAKVNPMPELWVRTGATSGKITPTLKSSIPNTIFVVKSPDASVCTLSAGDGTESAEQISIAKGKSFQVIGKKDGKVTITVTCGDQSAGLTVHSFEPTLKLQAPVAPPDQKTSFLVTATVTSVANGEVSSSGLSLDLAIPNQQTKNMAFGSSATIKVPVTLNKAGITALTGNFREVPNGSSQTVDVTVNPVAGSIEIANLQATVVIGDNLTAQLNFFDLDGQPIPRGQMTDHVIASLNWVKPLDGYPEPASPRSSLPVAAVVTSRDAAGKPTTDKLHVLAAIPGTYDITIGTKSTSTVLRVDVVAPVELESHLDTGHDPVDLFGPQVAREYYIFDVVIKNNLLFSEDAASSKNTTVTILGNTILFPATLAHAGAAAAPKTYRWKQGGDSSTTGLNGDSHINLLGYTLTGGTGGGTAGSSDNFLISAPEVVQAFADNPSAGQIHVMVSPLLLERYTIIKDAIEYRDPVNVTHRFFNDLFNVAQFFYDAYSSNLPTSGMWRGVLDPSHRTDATTLMNLLFADYTAERGNKGKIAAGNILSEHLNVPPGSPVLAYALISKATFKRLYDSNGLKLTIYPFSHLTCYYTVVSPPISTAANQAPQQPPTNSSNSTTVKGASGQGASGSQKN